MPKAKCSCGALLRIPDGKDRFRCPQCDKLLKLPSKKKQARKKPVDELPEISPIAFDPGIDEDAPTITDGPGGFDDDSSDEFATGAMPEDSGDFASGAMLDDDSDDEVGIAPNLPPRRRARAAPPEDAGDDEIELPQLPEFLRYPKARMWSRIQLALAGLVLGLPLIPLGEDKRALLDAWIALARNIDRCGLADLALVVLPVAGALTLILAALPLGQLRGQLVAAFGLVVGALTLGHFASLPPADLAAKLSIFEHLRPQTALGLGAIGAAMSGLMVAAALVRGSAPSPGRLRAVGVLAAIALLYVVGATVDAHQPLFTDTEALPTKVLGTPDAAALYNPPSSQAESLTQAIPYLHGVPVGLVLLSALLTLLGAFVTNIWVARVGAWSGMLGLLAIPLVGGLLAASNYGADPALFVEGLQHQVNYFGPIWGALALWTLGARDVMAENLRAHEPAEE